MNTSKLGIDIAKAKFDVALKVGERNNEAAFSNNPVGFDKLTYWMEKQGAGQVHACLEATGRYGEALALYLVEEGHKVSVVNPARIKKYADSQLRRNKTDAMDAAIILDFCLTQQPPAWKPPTPEQQKLRELARYHDALKRMRQQERNRLSAGIREMEVLVELEQHIAYLDERIEAMNAKILAHIDQHPQLKQDRDLLVSIPGIGQLTAARLLAEIPDIRAFDSAKQLAAFAGLTPSHWQSGTSLMKRPRLSKMGSNHLRSHLYMPAMAAYRYNPAIIALRERLLARGKEKMVVLGAAMRKLLHIVYGVLKSGRPFDSNIAMKVQLPPKA